MVQVGRIVINLWIINFLTGITLYAFNSAGLIPAWITPPTLSALNDMIERTKIRSVTVDPAFIFGDFITALNIVKTVILGENLGYLLWLISGQPWLNFMVQGFAGLSTAFLFIKVISNRYID